MRSRVLIVIGLVAGAVWFILRPSPEDQIRALLVSLADEASFQGRAEMADQLVHAAAIADYCSDPCEVRLSRADMEPKEFSFPRREVIQKLLAVRRELIELSVSVEHPAISVHGESATVELEARALGRSHGRDDFFLEAHRIRLQLVRSGGRWQIQLIENLDPIDTGDREVR